MHLNNFINQYIISKLDPDEKLILTIGKKQSIPYGVDWNSTEIPEESRHLHRAYQVLLDGNLNDEAHFCMTTCQLIWREATDSMPWNPRYGVYRKKSNAMRWIGFVADDVHTKIPVSRLRGAEPTFITETSLGNYQYPYIFETPVTDLRLATAFLLQAKAMGLTDRGGIQATKLCRLPTGINTKPSTQAAARLFDGSEHWNVRCVAASGKRYDVLDLAKIFGMDIQALVSATHAEEGYGSATVVAMPGNRYNDAAQRVNQEIRSRNRWGEKVLSELLDAGMVKTPDDQIESRHSDQGGFIDIQCPWAELHSHGGSEDGVGDTQFSPVGFGPASHVDFNQFICRHDHCADRTIHDFREWAQDKGFITDEDLVDKTAPSFEKKLMEMLQYKVTVATNGKVYDLRSPFSEPIGLEIFRNVLLPWKKGKIPLYGAWTGHKSRLVAGYLDFIPGKGTLVETEDGLSTAFNTWSPTAYEPRECSPQLKEALDRHFDQITGNDFESRFAKAFVASSIIVPWRRLNVCWLSICTTHRMGRGTVGEMVRALLGPGCFKKVKARDIIDSTYDDWALECTYIDIPEFLVYNNDTGGNRNKIIIDNIKQMITERVIEANKKYGKKGQNPLHCNIAIATNHEDCMKIDHEDGRFGVTFSDKARLPDEHYEQIYHAIDRRDLLEQIMGYFKAVDAQDGHWIRSMQTAPMTEGKQTLIEATTTIVETVVRRIMERGGKDMPWLSQALEIAIRETCFDLEGAAHVQKLAFKDLMKQAALELRRHKLVPGKTKVIDGTQFKSWCRPDDPLKGKYGRDIRYHNAELFNKNSEKSIREAIYKLGS